MSHILAKAVMILTAAAAAVLGGQWNLGGSRVTQFWGTGAAAGVPGFPGMQADGSTGSGEFYEFGGVHGVRTAVFPHHSFFDFSRDEEVTLGLEVMPLRPAKIPARVQLLTKGADSMAGSWQIFYEHLYRDRSPELVFCIHPLKNSELIVLRGKGVLQLFQWNQVRVTLTPEEASLFLNGRRIGVLKQGIRLPFSNEPLRVGHYAYGRNMMFPGIFSRLLMTRKNLPPPEGRGALRRPEVLLEENFSEKRPGSCRPLSGSWQFSGGAWREYTDLPGREVCMMIGGDEKTRDYTLYADIAAVDHMGMIFLDFYRENQENTYRLEYEVRETGNRSLRLWKIRKGCRSLLEEIPPEAYKELPVTVQENHPLRFAVHRYGDLIAVELDGRQWFSVRDRTFLGGGSAAVGCRGRKVVVSAVKMIRYPRFLPDVPLKKTAEHSLQLDHAWKRHAFYRGEAIELEAVIRNRTDRTMEKLVCHAEITGLQESESRVGFDRTAAYSEGREKIVFATDDLAPGDYRIQISGEASFGKLKSSYPVTVALRPRGEAVGFSSWSGGASPGFLRQLYANGFRGAAQSLAMTTDIKDEIPLLAMACDEAIKLGMRLKISYDLLHCSPAAAEKMRVRRADGTAGKLLNPANPSMFRLARERTTKIMEVLRHYPAFQKVLIDSEIENHFEPSFSREDQRRAEKALGFVPPSPANKSMMLDGTQGRALSVPDQIKKSIPAVFPDSNQWYRYFVWFWQAGFGDVEFHEQIAGIIRRYRPDMRITHDPFRDVPLMNRNRGLDCYGTWFYMGPDAGPAFMAVESLKAACAPGQKVLLGPSLWLYQNHFGPSRTVWAGVQPEALYMEALWLCLAACPEELELFGVDFLLPGSSPEHCPPALLKRLKHFSDTILRPYGGLIRKAETHHRSALLLSMGSQIFSHSKWGGYGWHESNAFLNLLWRANIPTGILFEEHIRQGALQDYDTLFLNGVTHLPESAYDRIRAFQKHGGKVVCDSPVWMEKFPGAVLVAPDMKKILNSYYYQVKRGTGYTADQVYSSQLNGAKKLHELFGKEAAGAYAQTASRELYLVALDIPEAKLVLAVNDRRTFGDYLGRKYRAVFDGGLPQKARVVLNQNQGAVYDLGGCRRLQTVRKNGRLEVELELPPAGGLLLGVYREEIAEIRLQRISRRGNREWNFAVNLLDARGKPVDGMRSLKAELIGPDGTVSPWSGFFTVSGGQGNFRFSPARNDRKGVWKLKISEVASGIAGTVNFTL